VVTICDVGPRDGLQNEPDVLAPSVRAELVNLLAATGLPRIEAGSFVAESTIANSILGRNVRVVRGTVKDSLVGDDQKIEGKVIQQSVMDAGEVAPAK